MGVVVFFLLKVLRIEYRCARVCIYIYYELGLLHRQQSAVIATQVLLLLDLGGKGREGKEKGKWRAKFIEHTLSDIQKKKRKNLTCIIHPLYVLESCLVLDEESQVVGEN